jgi:hypothetical protein
MRADAHATMQMPVPALHSERITEAGDKDEWSSASDLYLFKYAAPLSLPTSTLDVNAVISIWLQRGGLQYIDDLAVLLRNDQSDVMFSRPSDESFVRSYHLRSLIKDAANQALLELAYASFGESPASSSLKTILSRPAYLQIAPDKLEPAEEALARLRARANESIEQWADQLSADLASHRD